MGILLAFRFVCLRSYRFKRLSSFSLIFKIWFWSTVDEINFSGSWIYQRIVLEKSLRSKRQGRMRFFGVRMIRSNLAPNYTFLQADSYNLLFLLGRHNRSAIAVTLVAYFHFKSFCNIPLASKCLSKWRYDLNTDETGDILICGFAESVRTHSK